MASDPGERALCELCGRKGALEAAERRAFKGRSEALRSPGGWAIPAPQHQVWLAYRALVSLGLHGVPRRGAPCQAREESRAVWSARGLGEKKKKKSLGEYLYRYGPNSNMFKNFR